VSNINQCEHLGVVHTTYIHTAADDKASSNCAIFLLKNLPNPTATGFSELLAHLLSVTCMMNVKRAKDIQEVIFGSLIPRTMLIETIVSYAHKPCVITASYLQSLPTPEHHFVDGSWAVWRLFQSFSSVYQLDNLTTLQALQRHHQIAVNSRQLLKRINCCFNSFKAYFVHQLSF
jgi:hypothetical protein